MGKIKIGIFFGGPSREREISFAGGRTVYDNLDKSIFEAIPIFMDSHKQLIQLDWQYIYKGSIRDFYPPVAYMPEWGQDYQIYIESLEGLDKSDLEQIASDIGKPLSYGTLNQLIDVAFLALHGEYGEDGQFQGILDSMNIPYTGSGVLASAIGMDKSLQKKLMANAGFPVPKSLTIERAAWVNAKDKAVFLNEIKNELNDHFVIRPANQGSSIGVSILRQAGEETIVEAIDLAFFRKKLTKKAWTALDPDAKRLLITDISDIRGGLGMPLKVDGRIIYHPRNLYDELDAVFDHLDEIYLEAIASDQKLIAENFIDGKEFSCIVLRQENSDALALPPTEIIKSKDVYDYKSKYLPGLSRKLTPINLELDEIKKIQFECEKLFEYFEFHTYARIDGFYTADGTVFLNDPNTTSGMLPSSFFFHQAAELGLNPSQIISFIVRQSVMERMNASNKIELHAELLEQIDLALMEARSGAVVKKKIGVILGGYSSERHISVESGRNIYESTLR